MNINPFGLGAGLILVGLIADRKKLMRSVALEAHEGDDYMAEKLTKSKINYNQWAQGLSAMKRWKSYDRFLTHLATGAQPRDTKEAMMSMADGSFGKEMGERTDGSGVHLGNRLYGKDEEIPVWDLVENAQLIASDARGIMTSSMRGELGRTYGELYPVRDFYTLSGGDSWTGSGRIPHKNTGKPTKKTMTVYYRYQPSTGLLLQLGAPGFDSPSEVYRNVRFNGSQRITTDEYDKLMANTMAVWGHENTAYNFHLLRQMNGEDISDEKLATLRDDAIKVKSNRVNTLTGAERKLLRKTYMNNYFNGGKNPITGRDMPTQNWRIWDDSQKYDGTYGAKGGGLESIVYALKCSTVLPDVKTLRTSSTRSNATYKPSTEAYEVDKSIPSYRRPQGIVVVNNYDFMPHLETMEMWILFNEIARATPKITADIAFYKKKIDENQAIIDKYKGMDTHTEIYVRLEALKAQLMGEYGLEREKQQGIEAAEETIRQNKRYLKEEQDKLESLMNS